MENETENAPQPNGKLMTYSTQWLFSPDEKTFYLKRDPELAVKGRIEFNRRYELWDSLAGKTPADQIMRLYGNQVDGRSFWPDQPAGVILVLGKRYVNVPVRRNDRIAQEYQAKAA